MSVILVVLAILGAILIGSMSSIMEAFRRRGWRRRSRCSLKR